jgi:hypothetical protein
VASGNLTAATFTLGEAAGVTGSRFVKKRASEMPIANTPATMEMIKSFWLFIENSRLY